MNKSCFERFFIGISILASLFFTQVAYATTLEVGPGKTYTTIQDGIDAANPGDSIIVDPWTYYEQVIIDVPDVLLISSEFQTTGITTKDTTLIDAGGGIGSIAVRVIANGVTIQGFTIHNYEYGIYVENCAAVIDNCLIYNTGVSCVYPPRGIQAYLAQLSNAFVTITHNKIYDNVLGGNWLSSGGRGINVYSDTAGTACEILIDNNEVHGNDQRGISVFHIPATITDNYVHDNGIYYQNRYYNVGILLAYNKGTVLVQGNIIDGVIPGNIVYSGGIYLFADKNYGYEPGYYGTINIDRNIIDTGSDASGININSPNIETFDIFITNNTISGSTGELGGLYVWNMNPSYIGYVDIIEKNIIKGNYIGIFVRRCDTGFLYHNDIYDNTSYGIYYHKKEIQGYLDATNNWWGDKTGPSGGVTDPVTGAIADGSGDSVSENIHFDPWLQEPFNEIEVNIDIKPGSYPNSINLGSKGNVPVAIFSTQDFDATTVDPTTVTLAGASLKMKGRGAPMASFEDVNVDGLLDMIVHVDTIFLELTETDTEAVLEGETFDGIRIRGVDAVRVIE